MFKIFRLCIVIIDEVVEVFEVYIVVFFFLCCEYLIMIGDYK